MPPPTSKNIPVNGLRHEVNLGLVKTSEAAPICKKCTNGNKVTVDFPDGTYTFHSQWLHDASCDQGAARNALTAICRQPSQTVRVNSVKSYGERENTFIEVCWDDGGCSKFPIAWLRVMAPLVAAPVEFHASVKEPAENKGWTVPDLHIAEVSYNSLFDETIEPQDLETNILTTIDKILSPSSPGIIKITDLPAPNLTDERNHINNLNTQVLKKLFGSVFMHPIRGTDTTFNVASHSHDSTRKIGVPNYDTSQVLLPHIDHAFYDNPIQVMGFYGLEGTSLNTWTSPLAALESLKAEDPAAYQHLLTAPMTVGRLSRFYGDALYQATVDTPVTMFPGTQTVKRFRWHPNLTGSLLAPYEDYKAVRAAHIKFQETLCSEKHQLRIVLRPGDLYLWDNFRLLHGREKVMETPRTGVGQTVPEHVVHDRYRALCARRLEGRLSGEWLVHLPMPQLREMVRIFEEGHVWDEG